MADAGTISFRLFAHTKQFNADMAAANSRLGALKVGLAAAAAAAAASAVALLNVARAASDLEEQTNLLNVTFGQNAEKVKQWAETYSNASGLASSQVLKLAGDFGAVLKPMTGSLDLATDMSTAFAELAVDVASFGNLRIEDAFQKLRAGVTGEAEPLKQLGVIMNETALKAFALKEGISKQVSEMSVAEQTALRFSFITEALTDAQGDATKTAGSWANQVRQLESTFLKLREEIGQEVLPVMNELLTMFLEEFKGTGGMWKELGKDIATSLRVFKDAIVWIRGFKDEIVSLLDWINKLTNPLRGISELYKFLDGKINGGGGTPAASLPLVPLVSPGGAGVGGSSVADLQRRAGGGEPVEEFTFEIDNAAASLAILTGWADAIEKQFGFLAAGAQELGAEWTRQADKAEANAKLKEAVEAAALKKQEELSAKTQQAAKEALDKTFELFGPVMGKASGAIQASFGPGGPQAGLIALGATAIQNSKAGQRLTEAMDGLVDSLSDVVDAFGFLLDIVSKFASGLSVGISKGAEGVGKGLGWLGDKLGFSSKAIKEETEVRKQITDLLSAGVLSEMEEFSRTIARQLLTNPDANLSAIGDMSGPMKDVIKRTAEGMKKDLEAQIAFLEFGGDERHTTGSLDELRDQLDRVNEALEAGADGLDSTVKDMNNQLTNVPSGLKVALLRFRSAEAEAIGAGGGTSLLPDHVMRGPDRFDNFASGGMIDSVKELLEASPSIIVEQMNVSSDDPVTLAEQILVETDRMNFVRRGSMARRSGTTRPGGLP